MKKSASSLTRKLKPNHLRACVTIHRKPHSKEIAVSFRDAAGMTHRTDWCRSRREAEGRLKTWLAKITGIGFVSLLATAEVLEKRVEIEVAAATA